MEQLYKNHKKTIKSIAIYMHKIYGIEIDELESEGNLIFCEAVQSFDETKGTKFNTYLWNCLNYKLNNFCRKSMDKEFATISIDAIEMHDKGFNGTYFFHSNLYDENQIFKAVCFSEFIEKMNENKDCGFAINSIINDIPLKKKAISKTSIYDYFKNIGWKPKRIAEVMETITLEFQKV